MKLAFGLMLLLAVHGVLAFFFPPAHAVEVDFSTVLLDMDNQPIKEGDKILTLGRASMMALTFTLPGDQTTPGEERFKRGQLAARVYVDKAVDVSVEDLAKIKELVGKVFNPTVVLRAYPLLDPPAKK